MYRVLVVDDEQLVRDGLERMLNRIPYVTVEKKLKNGKLAKEFLENQWVDAVFTDIRMPVMDGLELTRYISVYKPECKIVLISAYGDFIYAQQAMSCGVKHYLMKPLRMQEIKKVIDQLIEERSCIERKLLWKHDLKSEIQELELYHALVNDMNSVEKNLKKKVFFADYNVLISNEESEKMNGSENLLNAAWTNIFRWCAPLCIPVIISQKSNRIIYRLLAEDEKQFPSVEDLTNRAEMLMGGRAEVNCIRCADARELMKNNLDVIAQDVITDCVIIEAKQFIAGNLSRNISRADVAEAVHLEPTYFSKYFKKKCGINFHDYLQQERIKKVLELLDDGYRVWDAATEAGFQNRNYFNQVFKQYVGLNPSDYRKAKRE